MTPEELDLIGSLMWVPGSGRSVSPSEVLRHFEVDSGTELGLKLLRDAIEHRDKDEVEAAVTVCFVFGITTDHLDYLLKLSAEDWHVKHEDVVTLLGRLKSPLAVSSLYHATEWVPDYLDYDEARALATKAIWALGEISGPEAERALMQVLGSECEIVREGARAQLERRRRA